MSMAPERHTRADKRLYRPALGVSAMSGRCWCSTATLSSPAGDIVVLRVAGEVDDASFAGLDAALDDVLDRRPDHLIVDLTGLVSCSSRGIAAIARAARVATTHGTRYVLSGATPPLARLWTDCWPDGDAPAHHRTTAAALLSAITLQADLWTPAPTAASSQTHPDDLDDTNGAGLADGHHPHPDVHDADPSELRQALHRHRSAVYRNALQALGASCGARADVDARLRTALARVAATPDDHIDRPAGAP